MDLSPVTVRFRVLVSHFMSPTEEARLLGCRDGEAQLTLERPGKPPIFIVIIDGAREEERSLRLRVGRLVTEKVDNQHVVVVANHTWMPEALRKISDEFRPKISLYQLNADGGIELKAKNPLPQLVAALKAQQTKSLPTTGGPDGELASESEAEFSARCSRAEEEKERRRSEYADSIALRPAAATICLFVLQAALLGLSRLWQTPADSASVLVQLGALVPPFVREGEWWRLLSSTVLHVGLVSGLLAALVLLSLGTLLEKLCGTARFFSLYLLSGLGGGLLTTLWPRASLVTISVTASAAICGLLAAGALLALDPPALPAEPVARLRKIALGGAVTTAILTFLPGVDRPAHLGGALVGLALVASGIVRPLKPNASAPGASRSIESWLHLIAATVGALLLLGSLALAIGHGHPWQPDPSWKKRLGAAIGKGVPTTNIFSPISGKDGGTAAGATDPTDTAAHGELPWKRRSLGETGGSLELPEFLGEAKEQTAPGRTPVYEFGDLGEKQQILSVILQRHPRAYKRKAQIDEAFDQAVIQVKSDKMRDGTTVLTPPARSTLDGWPTMEFHIRMQEAVQARGIVQGRSGSVIVLWYVFTDLVPETVQVDLKRALRSLRESGAKTAGPGKSKKRR